MLIGQMTAAYVRGGERRLAEKRRRAAAARGHEGGVIGDFAQTPRYRCAGSSVVSPTKLGNIADNVDAAGLYMVGYAQGYTRTGVPADDTLLPTAVALAKQAEVVLFCMGLDEISESEGLDRTHLRMPQGQLVLLEAVSADRWARRRCWTC